MRITHQPGKVLWRVSAVLMLTCAAALAQTLVTPMMGGGQTSATMAHIDIWYEEATNELHAKVDDSVGVPELRALEPGYAFDPQAAYAVLNGKAYNAQYGWNPGGYFTIPAGAAIWVALSNASPGLETYEGSGKFGSYAPIFGTQGSSRLWKWSGSMVHNTYAVKGPEAEQYYAEYHVYFGDATTGARQGFEQYDDAFVHLEWTTVPIEDPSTLKFGAAALTNGAPLVFVNADSRGSQSGFVLNLEELRTRSAGTEYAGRLSLLALPALAANGGPATNHASLGSCVEWEVVSLTGPPDGALTVFSTNDVDTIFSIQSGDTEGTNRIVVSSNNGVSGSDPFGRLSGQTLAASKPGLYRLGFRVVDTSTNGFGGGPIHTASEVYHVNIQAGTTIMGIEGRTAGLSVRFAGQEGRVCWLERTYALGPDAVWETVAGPLTGTNCLQDLVDGNVRGQKGWYRLRSTPQ